MHTTTHTYRKSKGQPDRFFPQSPPTLTAPRGPQMDLLLPDLLLPDLLLPDLLLPNLLLPDLLLPDLLLHAASPPPSPNLIQDPFNPVIARLQPEFPFPLLKLCWFNSTIPDCSPFSSNISYIIILHVKLLICNYVSLNVNKKIRKL